MASKFLGYAVTLVGVVVSLSSFPKVRTVLKITIPAGISDNSLFFIGLGLLVVGGLIAFKNSGGNGKKEVPIYHGEKIVGYRRTG